MDLIWEELTFGLPDTTYLLNVLIRLTTALVLGAVVGYQRERAGKPAGLRTHILVSLGTAILVVSCTAAGMSLEGLSRVIQGIITGIGFIGAGTILKRSKEHHISGLTTAAGIWLTAAMGVAAGLGSLGVALLSAVFAVFILALWQKRSKKADPRLTP
jgi:putative Mg2+ transporter-C (MgtC) family protein